MNEVITIGVDLAKTVFQVHGVDAEGGVIFLRRLRRGQVLPVFKKQPPRLIGMEACATSHHRGREIEALGHQVRLMAPR
ncbi:MAG: IS110 family transposase, partial [Alphaproteobacteria bacterium]|nr:IS110 family transposase [Alphaproteobacteria bacterium]